MISIGYVTFLFVDWSYQRRGYGRMLMEYWENDMRSQGYGMAMTSTQVMRMHSIFIENSVIKTVGDSLLISLGMNNQWKCL